MKFKLLTLLLVIIVLLSVVLVYLILNPVGGIKMGEPPASAQLTIRSTAVGGLQEQPIYELYDNKRLYIFYKNKVGSIEIPRKQFDNIQIQAEGIDKPEDIVVRQDSDPTTVADMYFGCMNAMVDGIDVSWTFGHSDGLLVEVDCSWNVDNDRYIIQEFNFFTKTLWMKTGEKWSKK